MSLDCAPLDTGFVRCVDGNEAWVFDAHACIDIPEAPVTCAELSLPVAAANPCGWGPGIECDYDKTEPDTISTQPNDPGPCGWGPGIECESPPTTVTVVPPAQPFRPTLPATGSDAPLVAAGGSLFLLVGVLCTVVGRRRLASRGVDVGVPRGR